MGYFDSYKFRCSALGKIMSPKGDLTIANKTYLMDLFVGEMEGVRKEITSKYFEKGLFMEEDGITLLNQTLYAGKLLVKNKERKENDFIHGEADTIAPDDIIYDIKNAFDRFSFGKSSLTFEYEWQLRGYMWLWDKTMSRLFYCLNNMPEHLLVAEERRLYYSNYFTTMDNPEYLELCEELRRKHNYDHLELWERFKVWDVQHSDEIIEKAKEKIIVCRKHLNDLFDQRMEMLDKNRKLMGLTELSIS